MAMIFGFVASGLFAQGNFTAEFDDGDLYIVGENNTEQALGIEGTGVDGEFRLLALGSGTTVNGLQFATFSGVTGDVTIDLRSGTKLLVMTAASSQTLKIFGDFEIKNRGNFPAIMLLDEIDVEGRTDVKTKNGNDALIINESWFSDRVRINTGNGNDVVQVGFDTILEDEIEVKTGGGADYFMAFLTDVLGETDLRMGGQNDTIGLYNSDLGDLSANGNGGDDALEVFDIATFSERLRSIEEDYNGGLPAMFAEARTANASFDEAVTLFTFFNLAN